MIGAVPFIACALSLGCASLIVQRVHPQATVTALFDALMADHAVRVAIIACWWWIGWHFLGGQTR